MISLAVWLNLFKYYCFASRIFFYIIIYYYTLYTYHIQSFFFEWIYLCVILKTQTRIRDREWKIQNEREMVMTIKRAWLRAENGAGEKESRVSRVTIRFGTAVVSVGSWALSICNSLYGVRDVCTWLYCIGHGNATRTISNYTMVDGKRSAGRGRVVARVVETLTRFLPLDVPL